MLQGELSNKERIRYLRHLLMPQVGTQGQLRLKHANILIIGAGGLGGVVASYLAAAGVGRLTLVDGDHVDATNLSRQLIHSSAGTQTPAPLKVDSARERIKTINPYTTLTTHSDFFTAKTAAELLPECDLICDCTDNFKSRYLINDAAIKYKKSIVFASLYHFEGQLSVWNHENSGGCLRCAYPIDGEIKERASCQESGVLGVTPAILGTMQAQEVIKIVLGIGKIAAGQIISYDGLNHTIDQFMVPINPNCICQRPDEVNLDHYSQAPMPFQQDPLSINILEILAQTPAPHIIDLRSYEEMVELPDQLEECATLLPMEKESVEEFITNNPHSPYYLLCQQGVDSLVLARELVQKGWSDIFSINGGVSKIYLDLP